MNCESHVYIYVPMYALRAKQSLKQSLVKKKRFIVRRPSTDFKGVNFTAFTLQISNSSSQHNYSASDIRFGGLNSHKTTNLSFLWKKKKFWELFFF